jgi:hypothetical protein
MADTVTQQVITYGLSGGGIFAALGVAFRMAYHRGKAEQRMEQMKSSLDSAHTKLRDHDTVLNEGNVQFATINTKLDGLANGLQEIKDAMIRQEGRK